MAEPPLWQRLLGLLAYLLPWSDALNFGREIYGLFPWIQYLVLPATPVLLLQRAIPFGGFLLFLVLFLVVVRNPQVPYFLRFNVLQAILLDIVLVVLSLAFNVLLSPLGNSLMLRTLNNTVFIGTLVLVLYALVQCSRGREPDLPSLSEAVRMQL
ncbi:MAG: Tic20 family protein [Synechococcus sp.]|nr:Tic20 family protein [Synechococcus sp.]|tara:strand:+ start:430 stop:894 length:465 start_codon:yes stop_codon:yes gene_type:complete